MIEFQYGREKGDTEKAVIPALIFINLMHNSFYPHQRKGFLLMLGWWDFYILIGYTNKIDNGIS